MKILIDLDDNVKAALDDYYSGKIGYIGLENGFKLLEAVKNGTSFSNKDDLIGEKTSSSDNPVSATVNDDLADVENRGEEIEVPSAKKDEICIQDEYDKRILARRYGNGFDCNYCGRSWIACKDDIIEGYEINVKLRCPYCHHMISIPRNYNWC